MGPTTHSPRNPAHLTLVPEAQDPLGNSCSSTGPPDPGTEDQGGGISNKTGIPSGGSHIRDQTGQKLGQVLLRTSGSGIILSCEGPSWPQKVPVQSPPFY